MEDFMATLLDKKQKIPPKVSFSDQTCPPLFLNWKKVRKRRRNQSFFVGIPQDIQTDTEKRSYQHWKSVYQE